MKRVKTRGTPICNTTTMSGISSVMAVIIA